MTLDQGCVYFDLHFPPDRGYAYVAVSRFRTKSKVYHYGKIRRTDWLAVDQNENDQVKRSMESMSTDSDDYDPDPHSSESDSCESEDHMWNHDAHMTEYDENKWNNDGDVSDMDDMAIFRTPAAV